MRLDKFLSHHLSISRTNINKLLKAGRIAVDNDVTKKGSFQLHEQQQVYYDGQRLEQIIAPRYFMLHKPVGYVCATDDPINPVVLDLLTEPMSDKLHIAGRLDIDTTGLVLLTDDGQWSHRITSPRHHCCKVYYVTVSEPLSPALVTLFSQGILLKNEKNKTLPALLTLIDEYHAYVEIQEGRYHQVKRMFAATGNHVVMLHRDKIGTLSLDVAEGEYRPLTQEEVTAFYCA